MLCIVIIVYHDAKLTSNTIILFQVKIFVKETYSDIKEFIPSLV